MSGPRLTVRARLTLLYTGLFAACGAIVVAVSYTLVARLRVSGQSQSPSSRDDVPSGIAAQCRSEQPVPHPDKNVFAQCVSFLQQQGAQSQRDLTLSHLLQYSLITLAVVIALAAILGWIFSGRALRPVDLITATARAASEHDLSARVAPTGPRDELRELAETFDEMLGRLQAGFESQQRFIANASHELRTPLAVMRATVDVVLGDPDSTPGDLRGMAADIRAAVDHAEHLISALLILARNQRCLTVRERVDLATAAEDVLDTAALGDRRVHAALEPAIISGDPMLAERLIANLAENAARYNHPAGDIWVGTRTIEGSSELTVANTGPVISAADVDRIFQPFERLSDPASHDGSGLGLAIVASIAAIHGGIAIARPRDEGGLSVMVTIPSSGAAGLGWCEHWTSSKRGFMFHVDSEVGRLRQVILHRPDLELKRLTPDNIADLLFDDMLWVSRAQAEHDAFADVLRSRGVVVHYYGDLLAQTLDIPEAREYVLDRLFDPRRHGPLAAASLRAAMGGLGSAELARYLAGGITKREIAEIGPAPKSIAFHSLDPDGFVLAPLPNLLYQRDTSCWIYGGVSVNAMNRPARMPETVSDEAIYRWHPMFAEADFDVWYHGAEAAPATIEGGDVLVIGNGAVLVGMSERTTPQAVEMLASRLFAAGAARCLVAIDMPKARAFMHLDTMLTMADYGVFVKYAGMGMLPSYTVEPGATASELKVTDHPPQDMHRAIAAVLDRSEITVLTAVQDVHSASREQWDDGCNVLAVSPGVVVAYERNVTTNVYLRDHGIEVLTVPGSELGRGRGGPRCMSCPIEREA